jgi:hypothetical protein
MLSLMFIEIFVAIDRSLRFFNAGFIFDDGFLAARRRCRQLAGRAMFANNYSRVREERLQARRAGGFFDGETCRDEFPDIVGGVLELRATGEVVISISKHNYWPITDEPSGQPLVATAALIG